MYDSEGKRRARTLVMEVATASGCKTYIDLWGGGESARMAVAAGLEVTSAEKDPDLRSGLLSDGIAAGFTTYAGDAVKVSGRFDFVFADFCGNANRSRFRELGALAAKANKWVAVTLSPDHQLDESMQGDSSYYVIPAWLIGATGMRLAYVSRYVRNKSGTTMWFAILEVRPLVRKAGFRGSARAGTEYDPRTVARALKNMSKHRDTSYWASPRFATTFPNLRLRRNQAWWESQRHPRSCEWCGTKFTQTKARRFCKRVCQTMAKRHAGMTLPLFTIERSRTCEQCGDSFVALGQGSSLKRFCRPACQIKAQTDRARAERSRLASRKAA